MAKFVKESDYEKVLRELSDDEEREETLDNNECDGDNSDNGEENIEFSDHATDSEQEGDDANMHFSDTDLSCDFFFGKDNETIWCNTDFSVKNARVRSKNMKILPGPRGSAKRITKELDAFLQIIDYDMIDEIVKFSNIFIERRRQQINYGRSRDVKITTRDELCALIGLLFLTGVKGLQHTNVREIWTQDGTGMLAIRACMGYKRFLFLLRSIRFDDKVTRPDREKLDKLAAIRSTLDAFIYNCKKSYNHSEFVTVDEKLIPFRGYYPSIQNIPSKTAKYGIKIFAVTDAKTFYTSNIEIYCGVQHDGPYKVSNKPQDIVHRLVDHIKGSNRNVTMDNWYTSYDLVLSLLESKLTCIGTLGKNKREIPIHFLPEKSRKVGSSLFGYQDEIMIVSHVPKKNKAVLLLSSMHDDGSIDGDTKKPSAIVDYNMSKGGVDTADQMEEKYSVARVTRRWPLRLFFTFLNLAGINAQVIFKGNLKNPLIKRRFFLKNLSFQLMEPVFQERAKLMKLPKAIRIYLERFKEKEMQAEEKPQSKRKRCAYCRREKNQVTTRKCGVCSNHVCKEHSNDIIVCAVCESNQEELESE